MPDQPIPEPSLDELERQVLILLIEEQPVWTVEDLGREIENPVGAIDAVAGLRRAGLAIQTGDRHVFATRAAHEATALIGVYA